MSESDTKPTAPNSRAIPLFSAVAALMSLLTAAVGPFAQTVKVVRVDSTSAQTKSPGTAGDFTLEISAMDLAPAERAPSSSSSSSSTPKHSKTSQPEKPAKIVQPLSGHWESAAQLELPLADVPPTAAFVIPAWTRVVSASPFCTDVRPSLQAPIKAGRAPPIL